MQCSDPRVCCITQDGARLVGRWRKILKTHHVSDVHDVFPRLIDTETGLLIQESVLVPCGKCDGCLMNKARSWTNRLCMEADLYDPEQVLFVTLTYSDEELPRNEDGQGIIRMDDVSAFLKRLRARLPDQSLRFFAASEFGGRTFRPHYHLILFGFDDPTKKFYKLSGSGAPLYRSSFLADVWDHGNVIVAPADYGTIAYTSRYCLKKIRDGPQWYFFADIGSEPESIRMSRKPGIGVPFIQKHAEQILRDDRVICPGVNVVPPRAFDRILSGTDIDRFRELIQNRSDLSAMIESDRLAHQDFDEEYYFRGIETKNDQTLSSLSSRLDNFF